MNFGHFPFSYFQCFLCLNFYLVYVRNTYQMTRLASYDIRSIVLKVNMDQSFMGLLKKWPSNMMDPLSRQFQQFVLFVCYWILILNFWGSRDSSVISSHYWVSILVILDFYCVMVLYPRSNIPKMM